MAKFLRKVVFKKPPADFRCLPKIPAELCSRTPLVDRLLEWRQQLQPVGLHKHAVAPVQEKMTLWPF